jgi:hypothetical protein
MKICVVKKCSGRKKKGRNKCRNGFLTFFPIFREKITTKA